MPSAVPDTGLPSTSPDPALVERFRNALADCRPFEQNDRLGVGVSGGPDSLALLLLAHAAFPGRIEAATVDHGLRPASADEARMVADLCCRLGVPHTTLRGEWDSHSGNGLHAAARDYRYGLLERWCGNRQIGLLATAHHLDDQAETLLMRLARGSGVGGLGAIRPVRPLGASTVQLVRPLLGFTKDMLRAIIAAAGLTAVEDPSNDNDRFDRTYARRLLAATEWLDPIRLAASADHLREADDALRWAADREYARRMDSVGGEWRLDPTGLPSEILRRITARLLGEIGVRSPSGPDLSRFIHRLQSGESATLGAALARPGSVWRFMTAPPRRN